MVYCGKPINEGQFCARVGALAQLPLSIGARVGKGPAQPDAVILAGADALAWIEPGDDKDKLKDLLRPFSPDRLAFHAVDTAVGNVRNNSPDCIKPIEHP